jgi:hypothetical protein
MKKILLVGESPKEEVIECIKNNYADVIDKINTNSIKKNKAIKY